MIDVIKQMVEALEDVGVLTNREWQTVHKNKANDLRQAIKELESQEPVCPECKAGVLYECVACSSNNYPPQRTEQEPRNVRERWNVELHGNDLLVCFNDHEKGDKCQYERYSPQRTWQGLTDEEKHKTWYEMQNIMGWYSFQEIAKAIEAKLKELNA